jgi:hypothetical protein
MAKLLQPLAILRCENATVPFACGTSFSLGLKLGRTGSISSPSIAEGIQRPRTN